jgi:FkbM family methyltransferase
VDITKQGEQDITGNKQRLNDLLQECNYDKQEEFFKYAKTCGLPVVILQPDSDREAAEFYKKKLEEIGVENIVISTTPLMVSKIPGAVPIHKLDQIYSEYALVNTFGIIKGGFDSLRPFFKNAKYIHSASSIYYLFPTISREFLSSNIDKFAETLDMLSDEFSKDSMINFFKGIFTNDAFAVDKTYCHTRYFPSDILPKNDEHIFIDVGAFDGDSLKEFIQFTKKEFKRAYCFEPDTNNLKLLHAYINKLPFKDKIITVPKGVSDKSGTLRFSTGTTEFSQNGTLSDEGNIVIDVVSLDEALQNETGKITIIKADIAGAELSLLQGAQNIIKRDKPTIALSVYHKPDDFIVLPQYIKSLVPEYRFFVRNHTYALYDTVLYATL